jgi:PAS domain S-box-containing protein
MQSRGLDKTREALEKLIEAARSRLDNWEGHQQFSIQALEEFNYVIDAMYGLNDELTTQTHRYQDLFDLAPYGYVVLDDHQIIEDANIAACELLKADRSFLKGKTFSIFLTRDRTEDFMQVVHKCINSESTSFRCELTLKPQGSTQVPILLTAAATRNPNGTLAMRCIFEDISELKQAHEELREKARQLEEKNIELERLAKVAAHDLQEPIRTMATYAQILQQDYGKQLKGEAKVVLGFLCQGATSAMSRIQDVLNYSSIDSLSNREKVDIDFVLTDVINGLTPSIENAKVKIHRGAMPVVMGNTRNIEIVFENLISNAIKFRKEPEPQIWISAESAGEWWEFSVTDNGIGMDPQFSDKIFLMFHRIHPASEYPGNGIGLALCKKIVENHGGRITVVSEPGEGSTFLFTLPRFK